MPVPTLNEGSRCFVKAKFFDKSGNPQIPSSISWRLDCETTGTALQDWLTVTPDSVIEVTVNATLNTIINSRNLVERKVLTFLANADPPESAFTEAQEYDLLNLEGIG
jgi:hypothetical protein